MVEDILKLNEEFQKIKDIGYIEALRSGPTGIGYTFETLLGKKEDQNSLPDYKGIEIKCKLGYSKSDTTLFTCAPKRDDSLATTYFFEKYSYHLYGNPNNYKLFSRKIFYNSNFELYGFLFKIYVDYNTKKVFVKSYKSGKFYENVCYWDFESLKSKLYAKLKILATIKGYPYRVNNKNYFKYLSINYYALKNFDMFLELIQKGDIYLSIYLKDGLDKIENHGFAFKIKNNSIKKLFYSIIIK